MRNQRTMAPCLKNNKTLQFKKVNKPQTTKTIDIPS